MTDTIFGPGAAIMIMSLVLFENEFLHIVAISFTALILNELIMVALEITTWYVLPRTVRPCQLTKVASFSLFQAYIYGHIRDCHFVAISC
jgi:hypothetical protein